MQHRVDHFESLVDFLSDFGASEDNLAADEDEEHNLWLNHAVNKTREQLRLVRAEIVMARCETFQTDGELDIARTDNVLDLEVRELRVEAELLNDTSVLSRSEFGIVFGFGTGDDHLSTGEDQSGCLWFTNTHDDGRETL